MKTKKILASMVIQDYNDCEARLIQEIYEVNERVNLYKDWEIPSRLISKVIPMFSLTDLRALAEELFEEMEWIAINEFTLYDITNNEWIEISKTAWNKAGIPKTKEMVMKTWEELGWDLDSKPPISNL